MSGLYESFPKNVHRTAYFRTSASKTRMQKALIQMLHKLNNETFSLEEVASPSILQCIVAFEFGIADEANFNYLDEQETKRVLETICKKPFKIVDFFCAVRYHKKKTPLKFDYYMLRFTFDKKSTEIQAFHERGPRHVSPEEMVNFLVKKANEKFARKILKVFPSS